jgi:hypothetical protein
MFWFRVEVSLFSQGRNSANQNKGIKPVLSRDYYIAVIQPDYDIRQDLPMG